MDTLQTLIKADRAQRGEAPNALNGIERRLGDFEQSLRFLTIEVEQALKRHWLPAVFKSEIVEIVCDETARRGRTPCQQIARYYRVCVLVLTIGGDSYSMRMIRGETLQPFAACQRRWPSAGSECGSVADFVLYQCSQRVLLEAVNAEIAKAEKRRKAEKLDSIPCDAEGNPLKP